MYILLFHAANFHPISITQFEEVKMSLIQINI